MSNSDAEKKVSAPSQGVEVEVRTPPLPQAPLGKVGESEKDIAFYSAMIQAWVDTRMELDRTLVALSAGGVGLLATLLTTVGVVGKWHLALYAVSAAGFLVALISELIIFQRNATVIEEMIGAREGRTNLRVLDRLVLWCFSIATATLLFIGGVSATTTLEKKNMSKDNPSTRPASVPAEGVPLKKSLDGIQNLAPKPPANPQPEQTPAPTQKTPQTAK